MRRAFTIQLAGNAVDPIPPPISPGALLKVDIPEQEGTYLVEGSVSVGAISATEHPRVWLDDGTSSTPWQNSEGIGSMHNVVLRAVYVRIAGMDKMTVFLRYEHAHVAPNSYRLTVTRAK